MHQHGEHARRELHGWSREEALAALEHPGREREQDPIAFWRRVGLHGGETVVDVGAGTGFFSFPAAASVGPQGQVYAVEISSELVDLLTERREARHALNLYPVLSEAAAIPLTDGIADVVLMANMLHDAPPSTIREAIRLLRPEGVFIDVDWKRIETPGGPPIELRLRPQEAEEMLNLRGLQMFEKWDLGPYHYVILAKKGR